MKSIIYFIFLLFVFAIWPFVGFVLSLSFLYHKNISDGQQTACLIVSSLFWGLLAFSQKSLADVNTDCIRYYYEFEPFEFYHPFDVFYFFDFSALLNFVFYPVSAFTVALTGNVQSVSLLWTFSVYILTFISVRKLMKYYDCYTNRNFANLVLCLTFCFIAFVQVSELLKQASAFAVFFYAFTLYITGGSKVGVILFTITSIGLHPSCIMLLPLFFYDRINSLILFIIAIIAIVTSQFVDVVSLFMGLLPGGNYTRMIMERFGGGASEGGSLHYLLLQLLMLCPAIYLWFAGKLKEEKKRDAMNIILLYFLVASLNYSNLVAYLRFAIFAHWVLALVYILFLTNIRNRNVKYVLNILVICMFLMTARWTIGRTTPGGYASSYMDNNIVDVVFSTSYDYLIVNYRE